MSLEALIEANTAALKALTAAILNNDQPAQDEAPNATPAAAGKPPKAAKGNGKAEQVQKPAEPEVSFEVVAKELTALGQAQGREAAVKALKAVEPNANRLGDINPVQYPQVLKSIRLAAEALV